MQRGNNPAGESLLSALRRATTGDHFWEPYLVDLMGADPPAFSIHLAILVEPYLQYVLDGRKSIESRFSARRIPPFEGVRAGDVLVLKRSGGPVVGLCEIHHIWSYRLDSASWTHIRKEFAESLCAQDPSFWEVRRNAAFATLMRIRHVLAVPPIEYRKRDRRAWVTIVPGAHQGEL